MPRKQKTVYEKIESAQNKIKEYQDKIKELEEELIVLNKEKDTLEMHKLFAYAKDNNLELDDVLKAINMFSIKNGITK